MASPRTRGARLLAAVAIAAAVAAAGIRLARSPDEIEVRAVTVACNGYLLAGDLHRPRGADHPVVILLLHGSSPAGRRLALYPELARRLAARGYAVLNLDQRGHGESEGPAVVRTVEDVDWVADARVVSAQLDALVGQPVRARVLVGHSFGGGVAAAAGLTAPGVDRVVSIAPGRRLARRFSEERPEGLAYVQQRRTRDLGLETPIPLEVIPGMLARYDIEQFRGRAAPKPFLLIEGAREPEADLAFTRELVASMSGPVTHRVLPGADHYFGTAPVTAGADHRPEIENERVLNTLVDAIDRWLSEPASDR